MATSSFTSTGALPINDLATVMSNIDVAGLERNIVSVSVGLTDLSHVFPDDLDMLLVHPDGQMSFIFWSDVGGPADIVLGDFVLSDTGAAALSDGGPIVSGTFLPTNVGAGDTFTGYTGATPVSAPPTGSGTFADVFGGLSGNGQWTLFIRDDAGGDIGSLASWTLTITTTDKTELDLNGATGGEDAAATFIEQTPVEIVPDALITDPDSAALQSLTLTLTNRPDGDTVEALGLNSAGQTLATDAGLTFAYDETTGVLTISGAASLVEYRSVLRNVVYSNLSEAPSIDDRLITVVAVDEEGPSLSRTATVSIVPVNDAPTGIALSNTSVDENVPVDTVVGTLSATDAEGDPLTFTLLDNSKGRFKIVGDELQVAGALNFEGKALHKLIVEVSDPGGAKTNTVIEVALNDLIDVLEGNGGANKLSGGSGADIIRGLGGSDKLYGRGGLDTLEGGTGADRLEGAKGKDILDGGAGKDVLLGQDGNDVLIGGNGADLLRGGDGRDKFTFRAVDESRPGKNRDKIDDFSRKEKDKIDVSAIDAKFPSTKNDAFRFIGTDDFSGRKGELRFEKTDGKTFVYGDVTGDGVADLAIEMNGAFNLKEGDFVL